MMFLLRMTFWLGVVLVLLPSGGAKETSIASGQESAISANEAVSAASATVSDMRNFCTRQPEACAVGAQAAVALRQRAQAGAKMVFEFLNERYGSRPTVPDAQGATKSAGMLTKASQHTLTPTDVAPAWRGPEQSRKVAQNRHPA
jgi:Family of unknown function (DUF5330)